MKAIDGQRRHPQVDLWTHPRAEVAGQLYPTWTQLLDHLSTDATGCFETHHPVVGWRTGRRRLDTITGPCRLYRGCGWHPQHQPEALGGWGPVDLAGLHHLFDVHTKVGSLRFEPWLPVGSPSLGVLHEPRASRVPARAFRHLATPGC